MSPVRLLFVFSIALVLSVAAEAQFRRGVPFGARQPSLKDMDGQFHFCRLVYQASRDGAGGSWTTDFPRADINMSVRLSELTRTNVSFAASGWPDHLVVRANDSELFQCPFVLMSAPGSAYFDDEEAARLREYLFKGGFLWADDFWGTYQWDHWVLQLRKVLPESFPVVDITPAHPLLRSQFEVTEIPQIPNIGYFMRSGGDTSEQGADSAVPHARIITGTGGRVLILMTHNTDIADSWEREADDPTYFYTFGPRGYAFGVNVILYAMTH